MRCKQIGKGRFLLFGGQAEDTNLASSKLMACTALEMRNRAAHMQHTNPSSCKLHWANGCMCTTWLLARFPTASAISRSRGTSKFVTPSARNRPRARSSARYLQHIKRYCGRETLAKLRHCKEVGKVFASKTHFFPTSTAFFRHSGVHEEACPRDSRKTCTERDAERRGEMFDTC
jgi:hypothetical protein